MSMKLERISHLLLKSIYHIIVTKMEEHLPLTVFLNRFLRPLPLGTILCGPIAFVLQYLVIRVLLLGFNEPLLSSSSVLEDVLASAFRSSSKQALHKFPASVECHRGVSCVPHLTHFGLLPSGIGFLSDRSQRVHKQ